MSSASATRDRIVVRPADRRAAVLEVIDTARNRLSLSIYRLDDAEVLAALGRARRRGVAVEALVTQRVKGSKAALTVLVAALEAAGLAVRRYLRLPKYHAKYLVADDRLALVGSLNFTHKCFENTCDFAVLTRDREVTGGLARLFEADYHGRTCNGNFGARLIVGPEATRGRYAQVLGQARRHLRIIDHKLTDEQMLAVIRERAAAGVAVDVLGRDEVEPLAAHGKLVIVDSHFAAIGSIALSAKGLDHRRELAIVLRDRAAINTLQEHFDAFRPPTGVGSGARRPAAGWAACEAI